MSEGIKIICVLFIISTVVIIASKFWIWAAATLFSRRSTSVGIPAQRVSQAILSANNVDNISIEPRLGVLTDRYYPSHGVIQLSEKVYGCTSVMAVAIAAHEVGHALQHAEGYAGVTASNAVRPLSVLGIIGAAIASVIGFCANETQALMIAAVLILAAIVVRTMLLPVEFDASRRAMAALEASGKYTAYELRGAKHMLYAAAFTYVASLFDVVMKTVLVIMLILLSGKKKDEKRS